jgi:serine/threonine-protein kinase HipA
MDREVLIYVDLDGAPYLMGRLWARMRKNKESATFEYDKTWLEHPARFSLEPALQVGPGPFHTPADTPMFGAIGDSTPDRWGRALMRRMERRRAEREGGAPRTLREIDFLLLVDDEARQGALRFAEKEGGPFLREEGVKRIPPLIDLPKLLSAAEHVMEEKDTDEELRLLFTPGSSLGGARPKASVREKDGQLAIAKFPRKDDEINTVVWEAVALSLAQKSGIPVAQSRVENVAGKPVLLLRRFDRNGERRIPYLSAMSMLGSKDRETRSYLEIVDALRQIRRPSSADNLREKQAQKAVRRQDDAFQESGYLSLPLHQPFRTYDDPVWESLGPLFRDLDRSHPVPDDPAEQLCGLSGRGTANRLPVNADWAVALPLSGHADPQREKGISRTSPPLVARGLP